MKKSHFIVGVLLLFSLCIFFYGCQDTLLTEQRFITQLSDIAKQDAVAAPELLAQTEEQKSYQINENATLDTVADPDTDALQSLILVLNTPAGSSYDREILSYYILTNCMQPCYPAIYQMNLSKRSLIMMSPTK